MGKNKRKKARTRRGRTPFSVKLGILIAVLVLTVVSAAVVMAPGLNVTEVYCEGNTYVSAEEIVSASRIETGKNIFLARIGRARKNISELPTVKGVEIRRVFPDKICVTVEERVPYAYISVGSDYAAIAEDKTVLKIESGPAAFNISKNIIPPFEQSNGDDTSNTESKDNKADIESKESSGSSGNSEKPTNSTESENPDDTEGNETDAAEGDIPEDVALFSIPVVTGVELKDAREGRDAKCEDEAKFEEVMKICSALNDAELLGRVTYIDISDSQNIRLVIENRLDVQLATSENIEYRARFLAEVVNNKISAYERAVLNYTGNDIYVRTPEDGKSRVSESAKKESKDEKSKKSSDDDDEEDDKEAADTNDDDDDDDDEEDNDDRKTDAEEKSSSVSRSSINL